MLDKTAKLNEALVHIAKSGVTQEYVNWLKENRERCRDMLETQLDSDKVKAIQGESSAYKRILEALEDASKR